LSGILFPQSKNPNNAHIVKYPPHR
jgi:hypothetical protein